MENILGQKVFVVALNEKRSAAVMKGTALQIIVSRGGNVKVSVVVGERMLNFGIEFVHLLEKSAFEFYDMCRPMYDGIEDARKKCADTVDNLYKEYGFVPQFPELSELITKIVGFN